MPLTEAQLYAYFSYIRHIFLKILGDESGALPLDPTHNFVHNAPPPPPPLYNILNMPLMNAVL